jgi:hypothetical protein
MRSRLLGIIVVGASVADVMAGMMLTAVDQRLPADRKELLPPR